MQKSISEVLNFVKLFSCSSEEIIIVVFSFSIVTFQTKGSLSVSRWASEDHIHRNKLNMADFILNMPLRFFAHVFGNPAGDPVLLKSRGVMLLRDTPGQASFFFLDIF